MLDEVSMARWGLSHENITVMIDNVSVVNVKSTGFLGVLIDENLSWKRYVSLTTSKIAKNNGLISHLVSLSLYYSMIYPFISYSNIAWASTHQTKLQPIMRLQTRAVRIIRVIHYLCFANLAFLTFIKVIIFKLLNLFMVP